MKKTLKYISVFVLGAVMLSSCSFLEQIPTTSLAAENVFSTENTAKSACLGLYDQLRYSILRSNFTQNLDNSSVFNQNGRSTNAVETVNLTIYSTSGSNGALYGEAYDGIAKCNQFLEGLSASGLSDEFKTKYAAEGRFIRAIWYFHVVRLFGNAPLLLSQPKTADESSSPRVPYYKIYKAILDDLDYAYENGYTRSELGDEGMRENRVYNYGAKAFKVKVLIQMACLAQYPDDQWFDLTKTDWERYPDFSECGFKKGDYKAIWQAAYDTAKDVMQNGPFALEPDFWRLWRFEFNDHPEDALTKEKIITIGSTIKTGSAQWVSRSMLKYPVGAEETSNNANSQCQAPTRYLWECWNKKYGDDNLVYGNTTKTDFAPNLEPGKDGIAKIGNYHFYSECTDPRISTTFEHTKTLRYSDATLSSITDENIYPNPARIVHTSVSNPSTYCVPIHRKGFSSTYRGTNTADCEFYYFRYADLILLAAEAAAELDKPTEAVDLVNMILKRARMSTSISRNFPQEYDGVTESEQPADWKYADYTDKAKLLYEIQMERVFELEHELHDWFDTRRRGAKYFTENFIKPLNVFDQQNANWGYQHTPYMQNGMLHPEDEYHVRAALVLPFPDYECRYNTAVGYKNQNDFFVQ